MTEQPEHHVVATGGRDWGHWLAMWRTLDRVHRERPITLLGIGGCYRTDDNGRPCLCGADRAAFEWAVRHAVPCYVQAADWDRLGRPAGPIRNSAVVKYVKPETYVVAPGDTGTADMAKKCAAAGARLVNVE